MFFLTSFSKDTIRITNQFICGNCKLVALAQARQTAVTNGQRETVRNIDDHRYSLEWLVSDLEERGGEWGDDGGWVHLVPYATAVAPIPAFRMGPFTSDHPMYMKSSCGSRLYV